MPELRTILGAVPSVLHPILMGVAAATDIGTFGLASLTVAGVGIAASAIGAIGVIDQSKHAKECDEIRTFVEQLTRQQGDWRRGLNDLLAKNGIALDSISSADASNPLVQFAYLLAGTQEQINSLYEKNTRLLVAIQRSTETRLPEISEIAKLTREDIRLVLTRQREQTSSLAEMQSVLERVYESVKRRPTLALPEAYLQPGAEGGNPFVFSERFVPLVGREKLLSDLHRFLDTPNISATTNKTKFAWWWLHGEGGCGKSRLAHELCIDARAMGWEAGRLEVNEPFDNWAAWDIDRPTLMVIDYAGDRGDTPARIIDTLATRASKLPHPVRVLLLDRSQTESLDKRLKEGLSPGGASAIGQREHLTDGAMPPLDELDLRSLIGFAHFWFTGDMPDLDRAYAVLRTLDPQPSYFTPTAMGYQWRARPLYACVLGYAISQMGFDKVERWTGDELLDWVLKEERRHWKDAGVHEHHVHAAVLATLTKGLALPVDPASSPFGDLADDGLLPNGEPDELNGACHMAAFAGGPVRGPQGVAGAMPNIAPISPDILGERFVLDRLSGELCCDGSTGQIVVRDTKRLICAALRHAPDAAIDFVDRAVRDFAQHDHVKNLWSACPDASLAANTEAELLGKVIQRLFRRGRVQEALALLQRLAELHQIRPTDRVVTAYFTDVLHAAGKGFAAGAQFAAASQMFQLALGANLQAFGERDARVAESLNFVGRVLLDTGQPSKAMTAFQAAEGIDRAFYGDAHPEVATDINNVGGAMEALGDAKGALEKYREAERITRAVYGDHHPSVATVVNNIGGAMEALGDAKGALEKYREAERIYRAIHGDHHASVATAVNNVGSVLRILGNAEGAMQKYLEAERIDRAIYGDHHPEVAIDINNVGGAMEALGDAKGALEKYREAERIDRAIHGDHHPSVAIRVNNVGSAMLTLGDTEGALERYREAERINRAVYGDQHPSVATSVNNVGGALETLGDALGALEKFREAERINRAVYGDDHPTVAIRVNNVGSAMMALGDAHSALEKYREAERIDRAVYGDYHPEVAIDINNVGFAMKALGNTTGAAECHLKALDILRRSRGPEHPSIVQTIMALFALGNHGRTALSHVLPSDLIDRLFEQYQAAEHRPEAGTDRSATEPEAPWAP